MMSPLALHAVSKSFGGKPAVSEVSFTVQPGEIIGFLGPNGAGKTTTLRMALGLIKPDQGSVDLFGQTPGEQAFGRIGFLPEERGLYKKQTARACPDGPAIIPRKLGTARVNCIPPPILALCPRCIDISSLR